MAKQAGKGVEEFRPYVTRSIPVGANIVCADNSGAKILEVINVPCTVDSDHRTGYRMNETGTLEYLKPLKRIDDTFYPIIIGLYNSRGTCA